MWECESDRGWVEFDGRVSAMLESAFGAHLHIRYETRFKVKGVRKREAWSDKAEYEIDWDTYEQVSGWCLVSAWLVLGCAWHGVVWHRTGPPPHDHYHHH